MFVKKGECFAPPSPPIGGVPQVPSGIEAKSYILAGREFPEAARGDAAMRPRRRGGRASRGHLANSAKLTCTTIEVTLDYRNGRR